MMGKRVVAILGTIGLVSGVLVAATATGAATGSSTVKAKRLLAVSGWARAARCQIEAELRESERKGTLQPDFMAHFGKIASEEDLLTAMAVELERTMDDRALDAAYRHVSHGEWEEAEGLARHAAGLRDGEEVHRLCAMLALLRRG